MIHPEVLKMGGIDTDKYQGFAFGLGLSRLAMMNKNISTSRVVNGCKLKELKQTKIKWGGMYVYLIKLDKRLC